MSRLRVLIADDHWVVREGLRMALENEEDIEVVGDAGNGNEAITRARELKPDIVLMDLVMPGLSGIDACHSIREAFPDTRVIMVTVLGDEKSVTSSLLAGAQGYVLKASGRDDLLQAIRSVGRGESVLDPSVTKIVTEGFSRLVRDEKQREVQLLTPREKDVLLLVARGATNREVSEELYISEYTARNVVSSLLGKLGVGNRSELVSWAYEHGVLNRDMPPSGSQA